MQLLFTQKYINNRGPYLLVISLLLLCIVSLFSISIGSVPISVITIIKIIKYNVLQQDLPEAYKSYETIIFQLRLPRVSLAALVGAALACAGAAIQGLLKNPLGDPYILGVSSGASVGAVLVIFFGITLPFAAFLTVPIISVLFGFLTIFLVLTFTQLVDKSMKVETIILTGIIFSSFLGSIVSMMVAFSGNELRTIIYWLLGSVSTKGWSYVWALVPFLTFGVTILFMNAKVLNALAFGEETAFHLGVNVKRRKIFILLGASILTGAAVAVSGVIGFVGLVIPHITRLFSGADHRLLLPLSFINGASFLIVTDLVARTVVSPSEIPIGVMTALIGAPVFAYLFYNQRSEKRL